MAGWAGQAGWGGFGTDVLANRIFPGGGRLTESSWKEEDSLGLNLMSFHAGFIAATCEKTRVTEMRVHRRHSDIRGLNMLSVSPDIL